MIDVVEREDINPICPHCSAEVRSVWFQRLAGLLGRRYIYYCGNCRKVLGVSHRKGFWMG
jgi:hypothetical protein